MNISVPPQKHAQLKHRLQQIVTTEDLNEHRQLIQLASDELGIDILQCAAALLFDSQTQIQARLVSAELTEQTVVIPPSKPHAYRNVRYRLDVGNQHQVSQDQLLAILIEESGVDRQRITRIEIRDTYTLVDLPDGMPADIFQLLAEAQIGEHKLNIKRVKPNRRRGRPYSNK